MSDDLLRRADRAIYEARELVLKSMTLQRHRHVTYSDDPIIELKGTSETQPLEDGSAALE